MIPQLVQTPITCKLCGRLFPLEIGVSLDDPSKQTANYVKRLTMHLEKHHRDHHMHAAITGAEFSGMQILMNFNLSGTIEQQRDFLRWQVLQSVQRAKVTDERIEARVRENLADIMTADEIEEALRPEQIGGRLIAVMREMRDVLSEKDRYRQELLQNAQTAAKN